MIWQHRVSTFAHPAVLQRQRRFIAKESTLPRCRGSLPQDSRPERNRTSKEHSAFIFGLGYTGTAVALHLLKRGWQVSGSSRKVNQLRGLADRGVQVYEFDPDNQLQLRDDGLQALRKSRCILSTVPPMADFNQDPVLAGHRGDLIHLASSVSWVGYLSSTGVYGDWQGDWVDERSEARAASGSGKARVQSEQAWLQMHSSHAMPVHVFRLGGIYGPGRSATDTVQRQGSLSDKQQRRARRTYTSRCHVLDICQVLVASMELPNPGSIYNIVDDNPAPRVQVMAYAEALLAGASSDELEEIGHNAHGKRDEQLPSNAAGHVAEKRVRNDKIKEELGIRLHYPSYQEGLWAIANGGLTPFD